MLSNCAKSVSFVELTDQSLNYKRKRGVDFNCYIRNQCVNIISRCISTENELPQSATENVYC